MMMDNICKSPFLGFVIGTQGDLLYCCMGIRDLYKICNIEDVDDLQDFFVNSEDLRRVRSQFENGEYATISPCFECFNKEKNSIATFRTKINERFSEQIKTNHIRYLEFTTSNLCNATCVTCNSSFSSSWHKHEELMGRVPTPISRLSNSAIEKIKKVLPGLDWMVIKGGEPFADENNFDILNTLFEVNRNCKVSFVTNMSILKDSHIHVLKKCPDSIDLNVSIDGTGKIYNWIRSTNFDTVVANMEKLYEETGIKFGITVTLSIYNYFNIIDIFDYFSNKEYVRHIELSNILHNPTVCSIRSLPQTLFETQKRKLLSQSICYDKIDLQSMEYLKGFQSIKEDKLGVFDHIDKMNKIRGFDICDHVPKLKEWRG
jgi:molybdenum cofactor biosynthesis enzyme MoaA